MNARSREDALLRALDILPPGDPAASDPALVKNPDLIDEARTARETAVEVWLAAAPLQMAPPRALEGLMKEVRMQSPVPSPPARGRFPRAYLLAAAGWAAALVLGGLLFHQPKPQVQVSAIPPQDDPATTKDPVAPGTTPHAPANPPGGNRSSSPNERKAQEEIARLKKRMEEQESQGIMPKVRGLYAPGELAESQEKTRDDLRRMLIDALRSSLEANSGAPGDTAALVIERGWLPDAFPTLQDGQTIRHRHFPEDSWEDYDLLKSPDGDYYDSRHSLIWSPDPEGRGFIGRPAKAPEPEAGFKGKADSAELPVAPRNSIQSEPLAQVSPPSGILVDDPQTQTTSAIIEGVSPPAEGYTQWVKVSDSSGQVASMQVNSGMFTPAGTLLISFSAGDFGGTHIVAPSQALPAATFSLELHDASGQVVGTLLQSASAGGGH